MQNEKAQQLIAELNELRNSMKSISDFKSVSEWLIYNAEYAQKHGSILHQIEALNK